MTVAARARTVRFYLRILLTKGEQCIRYVVLSEYVSRNLTRGTFNGVSRRVISSSEAQSTVRARVSHEAMIYGFALITSRSHETVIDLQLHYLLRGTYRAVQALGVHRTTHCH